MTHRVPRPSSNSAVVNEEPTQVSTPRNFRLSGLLTSILELGAWVAVLANGILADRLVLLLPASSASISSTRLVRPCLLHLEREKVKSNNTHALAGDQIVLRR